MSSSRSKSESPIPNGDVCLVCGIGDSHADNAIIYCERCLVPVHQACYAVGSVPKGDWYCDPCRVFADGFANWKADAPPDDDELGEMDDEGRAAVASVPRCELCPVRGGALKVRVSAVARARRSVWWGCRGWGRGCQCLVAKGLPLQFCPWIPGPPASPIASTQSASLHQSVPSQKGPVHTAILPKLGRHKLRLPSPFPTARRPCHCLLPRPAYGATWS